MCDGEIESIEAIFKKVASEDKKFGNIGVKEVLWLLFTVGK